MIYEDLLPHYLAIGCSYETFMNGTPYELKAFDKAYKTRRIIDDERDWYLGRYFMSAQGTVLAQAFSKDGHCNAKYIEKPFLSELKDEELDEDDESNELLASAEFMQYAQMLKRQGMPQTQI